MSVETRRKNIFETSQKYNTLNELPANCVDQVAEGYPSPTGFSSHQEQAAALAAQKSKFSSTIILEWCATPRPPLVFREEKKPGYENWLKQHSISVSALASAWVIKTDAESGAIKRVYEHVEI